jgi:NADPH2:quinone reductase
MDFVTGAALGNAYLTAYIAAVERGGLQPLETVLVTGASGGVGLAAVEIVKGLGATAIAGVTSAEKGALACRHGAAHWVDLSGPDLADSLRRQVDALTGGRGVDLIVDPVGGDVFDAALRTLAPGGRAAVIGFAAGRIPEVKTNYLLLKNLAVLGCYVEPYLASSPDVVEGAMADLFILHGDGKVRPEVSAIYPLEEFKTALGLFGKRQVQGKIVLSTDGK